MLYQQPGRLQGGYSTRDCSRNLADEPTIVALKESSENVRRITDIRNLIGDRFGIFIGVDDLALEAFLLGAVGWVGGLAGAFPRESVALYRLATQHRSKKPARSTAGSCRCSIWTPA